MVIIRLMGGLGNQMFQYALYLKMQSLGREVKLDISGLNEATGRIDQFFDIELPVATRREIQSAKKVCPLFCVRGFHRLFRLSGKKENIYYDSEEKAQMEILGMDDIYLSGYWQTDRYFSDIADTVRQTFVMRDYMTDYQRGILSDIRASESVSVHIRRGDYLELSEFYGNICTPEYYRRAFRYFDNRGVHFFIFSNDCEFVQENYTGPNITVVRPEQGSLLSNNMDLLLMSSCKHNILANSSFSWWGGWINVNPVKAVIAPAKWFNIKDRFQDIWCENWTKI